MVLKPRLDAPRMEDMSAGKRFGEDGNGGVVADDTGFGGCHFLDFDFLKSLVEVPVVWTHVRAYFFHFFVEVLLHLLVWDVFAVKV